LAIRTKLLAGLVLVLGISGVLTASTLIGLYSFRSSLRAFESKTRELPLGSELWQRVAQLDQPTPAGPFHLDDDPAVSFRDRIGFVEKALADYRSRLRRTIQHGRDPDGGEAELKLLAEIERQLGELKLLPPFRYWEDDDAARLDMAVREQLAADRGRFRSLVAGLSSLVGGLPEPTSKDMIVLVNDARATYTLAMWIASCTGLLVVVLLLVLSRLTYRWIFSPVRRLHASVQRVGRGDLSHRVQLTTGDEMEELAVAFNDMTARVEQTCHNLEQQVRERSRQLVRSEQLASVGFLAAGVAHEINNPLASISLGSEALERRLRHALPAGTGEADEVWRCLAMVQSEAFRCKGITEKLLDFSRLRDRHRQSCSITDLVAEVIDVVQHMGRYREKQIVLASPSDVVAEVSPQEIKQVVLNLVVNALDSMNGDGTLDIDVHESRDYAELVFTDDGCGMTRDVLDNIFEPFFTRSRTGRGTGLGLSITHRIITDHGGQITAESDGTGQGSRFTVRLPLAATHFTEEVAREPLAA
jgi:signal transduction histidine kinase